MDQLVSSQAVLQQLFQTDNPQQLFNEVYNKSFDFVPGGDLLNEEEDNINLPKMVRKTQPLSNQQFIPKTTFQPKQQNESSIKNRETLKNLLGDDYFQQLQGKGVEGSGGSIFESVVKNMQPNNSSFEDYEVEDKPKKQPPTNNTLNLVINDKSYNGRIVQNKKKQILFMVSDTQCFVLTPSDLKSVTKK